MNPRSRLAFTAICLSMFCLSLADSVADDGVYLRGSFTGAEMLRYCKVASDDSVRDFERGVCTGFIDGFTAGHYAAELWHAFHHRDEDIDSIYGRLCVPKDVKRAALVAVFVRYLENNRDNLDWGAGLLLETALREAYPCPEQD